MKAGCATYQKLSLYIRQMLYYILSYIARLSIAFIIVAFSRYQLNHIDITSVISDLYHLIIDLFEVGLHLEISKLVSS